MSRCCLISLLFSHSSHVRLFATPWTAAHQASLSFTISRSLLKFMSVESEMPFNHCILCRPLKLALHIRWPKYWNFTFRISLSNEYSGLISFRIDWFDFLAVQGTLKSLLQHTVQKHQFFCTQLSLRRRQWHPTPVLLSEKSHGRRCLVGCIPCGH